MNQLIVLTSARLEEQSAAAWYGRESADLRSRFRKELKLVLRRIQAAPLQFPIIEDGYRRALLEVFPYSVIFEQSERIILVVAIAHNSRSPSYWRNRRPPAPSQSDLL